MEPRIVLPGWQAQAACRGIANVVFFPPRGRDGDYETARRFCRACGVVGDCLAVTMRDEGGARAAERFGMRGMLTPSERARLATIWPT